MVCINVLMYILTARLLNASPAVDLGGMVCISVHMYMLTARLLNAYVYAHRTHGC